MGLSDLWKKEEFAKRGDELDDKDVNREVLESGNDMIGHVIGGKYVIEEVLGYGGMGVLYLAKHKVLGRKYVIKIIRLHLVDQHANVAIKRFRREAQALAKVPHRNIVEVVDYDTIDERTPYFVMEYVEGDTLAALLENNPMGVPHEMFLTIMQQLCEAMAVVHAKGIVHRDLKPTNIMIQTTDDDVSIKVLDFGLVHVDAKEFESAILKLTGTGQVIGTPAYMSPEQCRGNAVDQLSDIYAIGLLAYEMLAGVPAVDGESFIEIIEKQLSERPDPLLKIRSDVPSHIVRAIDRALSKEPADRYQSTTDFFRAISGEPLEDEVESNATEKPAKVSQKDAAEKSSKSATGIYVMIGGIALAVALALWIWVF